MIRDSCHGLPLLPRSEDQIEFPGDDPGIIIKDLVKIPHTEKDNGIGILFFDRSILSVEGGILHSLHR
jgi:hypothetical protein